MKQSTLSTETILNIQLIVQGAIKASHELDLALIDFVRCGLTQHTCEEQSPLAQALVRIASVVEGEPIASIEQAQQDMLFLWGMLRLLASEHYIALREILDPAHVIITCASMIDGDEARKILNVSPLFFMMDVRLDHIHPIVNCAGEWVTYNPLLAGDEEYRNPRYARYEIEALKALHDCKSGIPL